MGILTLLLLCINFGEKQQHETMDANAKKVEIIQHIIMIQNPDTLIKIDRFIHGLDYEDEEERSEPSSKKGPSRANVLGSKIKGMLKMYE